MNRLIIHGGAGNVSFDPKREKEISQVLQTVLLESYSVLRSGTAKEAVIHSVCMLEDYPIFNAGTGSKLQGDGKARLSASIIDSSNHNFSGVINIQNIRNPVVFADSLAKEKNHVLSGIQATQYSRRKGFPVYNPITEERIAQFKKKEEGKTGTVGAVALDDDGIICAASSTGGTGNEIPGRVSDSATVAGNYVSENCGVTMTGIGEHIVNTAAAARIVSLVDAGFNLTEAIQKLILIAKKQKAQFGLISLDSKGYFKTAQTTKNLYYASYNGKEIRSFYKEI